VSASDDGTRPLTRTVFAWRRTALSLVGLCIAAVKVTEWSGGYAWVVFGSGSLIAACVVVAYAELGVRRYNRAGQRPVFELLTATASLILILAVAGLVLAVTA